MRRAGDHCYDGVRGGDRGDHSYLKGNRVEEAGDRGIMDKKITEEEVGWATTKLKRGKACGKDRIPNEFLKELTLGPFKEVIRRVCEGVRKLEYVPKRWKESRMVLLFKGGEEGMLDNYRGISINSNVGKIFTRIMERRLT